MSDLRYFANVADALDRAEKAEAQVERMRGLLSECADDLESYINAEYPVNSRDAYPSVQRRYLRDMELVTRVRAKIAEGEG